MPEDIIQNHPHIGFKINCPKGKKTISGTVVAVKSKPQLFSAKTEKGFNFKTVDCVSYKVQPDDGGRCFWSAPVVEKEEAERNSL
jgi:hypothetical protein